MPLLPLPAIPAVAPEVPGLFPLALTVLQGPSPVPSRKLILLSILRATVEFKVLLPLTWTIAVGFYQISLSFSVFLDSSLFCPVKSGEAAHIATILMLPAQKLQ